MATNLNEPDDEEWSEESPNSRERSANEHQANMDKEWMMKYQQLVRFKQTNGSLTRSRTPAPLNTLVRWQEYQRKQFRRGRMRSDRKKLLDDIGFCWKPPIHLFNKEGLFRDDLWNVKYQQLVEFKETHGHCLPVRTYNNGDGDVVRVLARWVEFNRVQFRRGRMPQHRKKLLDDIGFHWSHPGRCAKKTRRCSKTMKDSPSRTDATDNVMTGEGEPEYAVGTKVQKFFDGYGWFVGSVTGYDGWYYEVTYEDGDQEGCSVDDLARIVLTPHLAKVEIGSRVAVHWPDDGQFYDGTVTRRRNERKPWCVEYDEGSFEWLDLGERKFRLLQGENFDPNDDVAQDDARGAVEAMPDLARVENSPLVAAQMMDTNADDVDETSAYSSENEPDEETADSFAKNIAIGHEEKETSVSGNNPHDNIIEGSAVEGQDDDTGDDPEWEPTREAVSRGKSDSKRWSPKGFQYNHEKWNAMYHRLLDFKRTHGHFLVRRGDEVVLNRWVQQQRRAFRLRKMLDYRKKLLDEVGFCWSVSRETTMAEVNDAKWMTKYRLLVEYKEANGHCVVQYVDGYKDLCIWVRHQRASFKNRKLPQTRKKLLDEIGFCWNKPDYRLAENRLHERKLNDDNWMKRYEQLVEYKRVHGHCLVKWSERTLWHWASGQRRQYRANTLPEHRKKLLDEIGFYWVILRPKRAPLTRNEANGNSSVRMKLNDDKWMKKYEQLLEYKRVHGHCLVKWSEKTLWPWVNQQRYSSRSAQMPGHRKKLLDKIGFCWEPAKPEPVPLINDSERKGVAEMPASEEQLKIDRLPPGHVDNTFWKAKYQKLVVFKQIHGHCKVKYHHELYQWAKHQRKLHQTGKLREDRKKLLEAIDFSWEGLGKARNFNDEKWKEMYRRLLDFKRTHGHFHISPRDESQLSHWTHQQRKAFRLKKMPEYRKKLLDEIGFCWVMSRETSMAKVNDAKWMARYRKLVVYKDINGDCMVKWNHKELGQWVKEQRALLQGGKLSQTRKKLLDEIGFCWNKPVHRLLPKIHLPDEDEEGSASGNVMSRTAVVGEVDEKRHRPGRKFDDDKWLKMYEKLVLFKRRHGQCLFGFHDKALGKWVRYQRETFRLKRLPPHRKKLMDEIGFCWNPPDQRFSENRVVTNENNNNLRVEAESLDNPVVGSEVVGELDDEEGRAGRDGTAANLGREPREGTRGKAESSVGHLSEYDIGTKVRKYFESYGWFTGEVTSYDGEHYMVTYEDGDSEEYNDTDLSEIVLTSNRANGVEVGSRVAVQWPDDGQFYEGTVTERRNAVDSWRVDYDDGSMEWLDLCTCTFHLLPDNHSPSTTEAEDESMQGTASNSVDEVEIGARIWVQWPSDKRYYGGTVTEEWIGRSDRWRVDYDDGSSEWVDLRKCRFRLEVSSGERSGESDAHRGETESQETAFRSLTELSSESREDDGNFDSSLNKASEYESLTASAMHWVGPKVKKFFEGSGWCTGTVTSCQGEEYHVTYENGTSECYSDDELSEVLFPANVEQVKVGSHLAVYGSDGLYHEATVVAEQNERRRPLCIEHKDGSLDWIDIRQCKFRLLNNGPTRRRSDEIEEESDEDDDDLAINIVAV